ncbi:MAG TPA: aminoglycoside phosphotransferase family protein [Acidimicrobiales bacterium]|nr:aminoglycoside phosphotransferase family protein [Acidimicrobiales bacterium]
MIQVPEVVRSKARVAGAERWLADLPDLVASLEVDWSISIGGVYDGGTEALVVAAALDDGTPAVLKLLVPRSDDAAAHEITVLRLADGEGCARLLQADADRGALLLERLGRSLSKLDLPLLRRMEVLTTAAARMWRPAAGHGLPTGAEKGRWLADFIPEAWERLDRPCAERSVDHALACAERRIAAHDDERAVLVHGDVHQWNALEASDGFKLVDPDGLLAEAEYDLGILMREDPVELMDGDPRERSRWLAATTGLDETAIWEWGVVERVSTGLVCAEIDLPDGRHMLTAADRLAREG